MAVGGGGCGGCRRSYGRGWAVEAVEVVGIMAMGWTGVGGVMAVGGGGGRGIGGAMAVGGEVGVGWGGRG